MRPSFVVVIAGLVLLTGCPEQGENNNDFGRVPKTVTIEVRTLDTLRFDPPTLRARAGQTVTFKVSNAGGQDHQFNLGEQIKLRLKPGETKEATETFAEPTQLEFMCRVKNHEKQGMVGRLTVS